MIGFWIFMVLMDLLIPFTMIGFGKLFLTKTPKKINALFGYRTVMSMKNEKTWEFAHKLCGKLWFRCGLVSLPISIIPLVFVFGKNIGTIGTVGGIVTIVQLVLLIGTIIPVEVSLKRTFDQSGKQKI